MIAHIAPEHEAPKTRKRRFKTREQWLNAAVPKLARLIREHGWTFPEKWQVSVGFPRGSGEAIGQCWTKGAAVDGETWNLFVAPDITDPVRVLGVLLHEMIHATVGLEEKHGGQFKKLAQLCGLTGKMTATTEGPELVKHLTRIADQLGEYPHVGLHAPARQRKPRGKGRTLTLVSVSAGYEDYKLAIERRFLEDYGPPLDPAGVPMEPAAG